jgi:putative secretion ATPase (PEP-CTERM system associated)
MYERFYHLRDRPFALSPDPDYLYPSRVHREALDYLRFGIEGDAGFVVITGEIGSGKTTLLQVLLRNLDGQTTVIRLVNTLLTGRELIESMLLDLGVANPPATKPGMLRELARLLIEERTAGRRVVTVIDEAQNLSREALEELRMLSNLETEKSKLMQIVLVGQPDLRDALEDATLEQLRQRVTVRYHIDPIDADETEQYINHRLQRAALAAPLVFSRAVSDAVHARSGGVPRLINVICDAVLLCGYAEECRQVDVALVRTAVEELELSSVLRRSGGAPIPSSRPPSPPHAVTQLPITTEPLTSFASEAPRQPVAPQRTTARPEPPDDLPLRTLDAARNRPPIRDVRQPAARPASPAPDRRAANPLPAQSVRPAAQIQRRPQASSFRATQRPTGPWSWMKEVFFGYRP